jgi:hypothetical protein
LKVTLAVTASWFGAFGEEALVDLVRVHPAFDQLEGDSLLELAVGPLGEIDHAHPAAS